jgi:tryptophan 2,3-dioxygenase
MRTCGRVPWRSPPSKTVRAGQEIAICLLKVKQIWIPFHDELYLVTVARVIGQNTGTGGSTGLRYLQKVAIDGMENPLFPEIWEVRNRIYEPSKAQS